MIHGLRRSREGEWWWQCDRGGGDVAGDWWPEVVSAEKCKLCGVRKNDLSMKAYIYTSMHDDVKV